jgi:hypothetical protein
MAQSKPSDKERMAALFASPSKWGEAFLSNRDGTPRKYRPYQVEDLECEATKIAHLDGRSVGKTIDLAGIVLWYAFTHPGKSILIAAPFQGQLDTIANELEYQMDSCHVLHDSIVKGKQRGLAITRKPYWEVPFTNGAQIFMRPAGTIGSAFRSLHVDFLLVDEAAWIPEQAWIALRSCLNPGGKFRVYSTPNGMRNTFYHRITQSKDWKIFRWPSWISPDWTPEHEREMEEFYGGKDTPGWQHEVAGEHGAPSFGAFSTPQVMRSVVQLKDYRKATITGSMIDDCVGETAIRERLLDALNLPGGHGTYWLGGDLGYTSDPTELVLFEEVDDVMRLLLRVHCEHVPYPALTEIIAIIDRVYTPLGIGLDRGGNGMSVVQELTSLDKYRDLRIASRLIGYDFGGTIAVGEDENGKPIKKRVKEQMTTLINEAFNSRRLELPKSDGQIEDQFCTQTYTLTENGVVYSKGNDHIVDAIRCAVLRRAQEKGDLFESEIIVMPSAVTTNIFLP